ncbi:MAG: O-antigen ligase family protein [Terriglobia bacterium]|jgi:Tfp pilus assembly protein PilF/O-antigen ligase
MTLPDSVFGAGIALLFLLCAVAMQHLFAPKVAYKANIGDFSATVYVGLQFATLAWCESLPNTIHFIPPSVIALCFYFSVRLLPLTEAVQVFLLRIVASFGLLLAVSDLVSWAGGFEKFKSFPRSSILALHAYLPLIGGPSHNDSIMIVLAVLPYALASWVLERGRNPWFLLISQSATAALTTLLVLSFSRGIYLAFAVLVIATVALMKKNGSLSLRLMASICLVVGVVVASAIAYFGVQNTVIATVGNKTTSQRRSTTGRMVIWRETLHDIEEHPLLGIGGYADGLESLSRQRGTEYRPFTARTYNAPLEAFLSSGLLGFLSYGTFLLYPIIRFITGAWISTGGIRQTQAFSLLTGGIIALIARDMTYSSLVLDGRTILVTWLLAALVQDFIAIHSNEVVERRMFRPPRLIFGMAYIAIGLALISIFLSVPQRRSEIQYGQGLNQLSRGDYTQARRSFQNAISLQRKQPMFYAAHALATFRAVAALPSQPWKDLSPVTTTDEVLLREAEDDYRSALSLSKNDPTFWSNLGWVEAYLHNDAPALEAFRQAVLVDPQDSASRVGLGLCYERRGLINEALEQYAHALALSPHILDSQFFTDLKKRNPSGATTAIVRCLDILNTMPSSPIVLALIAKVHAYQGQDEAASLEYTSALQELPYLSYTWANLGSVELALARSGSARLDLQRALNLDASNRIAANKLASMAFSGGDLELAKRLYIQTLFTPLLTLHAFQTPRIYFVLPADWDDLVPSGLLDYVNPPIEPLNLCGPWLDDLARSNGGFPRLRSRLATQQQFCSSKVNNSAHGN